MRPAAPDQANSAAVPPRLGRLLSLVAPVP